MGASGSDVQLSDDAFAKFPFSVECKNTERLDLWSAWEQAKSNNEGDGAPLVVIKRNRSDTLAVLDFNKFMEIVGERTRRDH